MRRDAQEVPLDAQAALEGLKQKHPCPSEVARVMMSTTRLTLSTCLEIYLAIRVYIHTAVAAFVRCMVAFPQPRHSLSETCIDPFPSPHLSALHP